MSDETRRAEIATKRVVYRHQDESRITVERDLPYTVVDGEALTLDAYYPPAWTTGTLLPAVLFVTGYSDRGMQAMLGCKAKEMESYISWARLVAASGAIAITYSALDPAADAMAVFEHVRRNARPLGIDVARLGVWACSGNVPNALSLLMRAPGGTVTCAALCYGYMLDFDGSTLVADSATTFRFANPAAGTSFDEIPRDVPVLVVRAGRDEMPNLNTTIDRFVAKALQGGVPLALVNHPTAPHAFDISHDSAMSRAVIGQILAFLRCHLLPETEGIAP